MTMDHEHLPEPIDPSWADVCVQQVTPHLPPRADVVATKQKQRSTAVFLRCIPSMNEGAIDRLVVTLQEDPAFKSLFHFTQGRKMVAYFSTPDPPIPWEDFEFIND